MRPGLHERLAWMADNVWVGMRCGACCSGAICEPCIVSTLKANGGKLPTAWKKDYAAITAFVEANPDVLTKVRQECIFSEE